MTTHSLKETMDRHRKRWMQLAGVTGVAVGLSKSDSSQRCIQVYVTTDEWPEGLERVIEGHPVEIVRTKPFRAF
jgi:hypothetical protein